MQQIYQDGSDHNQNNNRFREDPNQEYQQNRSQELFEICGHGTALSGGMVWKNLNFVLVNFGSLTAHSYAKQ